MTIESNLLQMYERAPLVKDGKDARLSDMGTRGCPTEGTQSCRKALHSSWLNGSPQECELAILILRSMDTGIQQLKK